MRFSGVLMALLASTSPDISIFDSKTVPGQSWILVDDCAVQVKTYDIQFNQDKVLNQVNEFCGLNLDHVAPKK